MKITKQQYQSITKKRAPRSPLLRDCAGAFVGGGLLCALGEVVILLAENGGFEDKDARLLGSLTLIALSAVLTAFHVYDNVAKYAGAGTLVPITGLANAVASPAIDTKAEGFIRGVGANMFKIAGPVIVYGTLTSVVVGIIYWIISLL